MRATKHHDINTEFSQSFDETRTHCFFPSHKINQMPSTKSYSTIFRFFRSALTRGSIAICVDVIAMTSRHFSKLNVSTLITASALKGVVIREITPNLLHIAERFNQFANYQTFSCQNYQNTLKLYDNFLTKSPCDLHHQTRTVRRRMYFEKISSLYSVENTDFDSGVITS